MWCLREVKSGNEKSLKELSEKSESLIGVQIAADKKRACENEKMPREKIKVVIKRDTKS